MRERSVAGFIGAADETEVASIVVIVLTREAKVSLAAFSSLPPGATNLHVTVWPEDAATTTFAQTT